MVCDSCILSYFSCTLYIIVVTIILYSGPQPTLAVAAVTKCCTQMGTYGGIPVSPLYRMLMKKMLINRLIVENYPVTEKKQPLLPDPDPVHVVPSIPPELEKNKALRCSKLACPPEFIDGPVCACNFNKGNVVSFKDKCEMKKHNCRFDTAFRVILKGICPWEYESRRSEPDDDDEK